MLQKADALLDALSLETELTAAELAGRIGEPRSSVYRLLSTLRTLGYVESGTRQGGVRLGLKCMRLGHAVSTRFDEREAALPGMKELWDRTGETIFLCVRRGDEAVCIERLDGERVQTLELKLGSSQPLYLGAAPRVLLAFESDAFQREYVARAELTRMTPKTIVSRRALLSSLQKTRECGYAISDEDVTIGIAAIGAPVFDHRGQISASVSISGTRPLILGDRADKIEAIKACGREASLALGWAPEPAAA